MLQQQIKEELKNSMKNRDQIRSLVLKSLISAFVNELVSQRRKPQEELSDADAISVIKKAVKQRKDSIEQYGKGGREDLVASEKTELEILEKYLPVMLSEEKIKEIALTKKTELGIEDKTKIGILIGAIIGQIKSTGEEADGALIKKVVENLF